MLFFTTFQILIASLTGSWWNRELLQINQAVLIGDLHAWLKSFNPYAEADAKKHFSASEIFLKQGTQKGFGAEWSLIIPLKKTKKRKRGREKWGRVRKKEGRKEQWERERKEGRKEERERRKNKEKDQIINTSWILAIIVSQTYFERLGYQGHF